MCLQALIAPPWGQKYYVVNDTCIHICNMCCVFLQEYFIEISNDNEVLSVAQKITAHIETSARQCQVTTVHMYVDHYVFIIHEINMYYHRHVYRLYVYVCAMGACVCVCVCLCYSLGVCMCVNKYKYTCTCRSVISYLY